MALARSVCALIQGRCHANANDAVGGILIPATFAARGCAH